MTTNSPDYSIIEYDKVHGLSLDGQIQYYADLYEEQVTDNPFFRIPIPKKDPEESSVWSWGKDEETTETTEDGFVIRRGIFSGKPSVILDKYRGNEEIVRVPEGVESIGYRAFAENKTITTVYLPESIRRIRGGAFSRCEKLSSVIFHEGTNHLEEVEPDAFDGCKGRRNVYKSVVFGNILLSYDGTTDRVAVPKGVAVIASKAFEYSRIRRIVIPEGVHTICPAAFQKCSQLREVVLPEGLETIGRDCFRETMDLKRLVLPKSVKTIGRNAFLFCGAAKELEVGEELAADKASYGIPDENQCVVNNGILEHYIPVGGEVITISNGVVVIEKESLNQALRGNSGVSRIVLPDSVRMIRQTDFG